MVNKHSSDLDFSKHWTSDSDILHCIGLVHNFFSLFNKSKRVRNGFQQNKRTLKICPLRRRWLRSSSLRDVAGFALLPPCRRRLRFHLSLTPPDSSFFSASEEQKFHLLQFLFSTGIVIESSDSMKISATCCSRHKCFSSSSSSSSLPWISPLKFRKAPEPKPDPPPEISETEPRRKGKYISHETAINLIKREKDPQHALKIFNMVSEQKGFNHNSATYGTILEKLAQMKKFQAIDRVLHQMTYETCKFHEGIFINLMKHFSKSTLHKKVLQTFFSIQPICREKPSPKAISTCLNLLVDSNQIDLARQLLLHAKRSLTHRPNVCIFNILVKYHCKNGDLESAFEVVKEMRNSKLSYPNLITYSTLMDGLSQSGRLKEAFELFEEMVSKDQLIPDPMTYNVLINGFCRGGKPDRARNIIEFMKNNGCSPNVFNYSALVNGFCKAGKLQEAKGVLAEMKSSGLKPDAVSYTALINFCCRNGQIDEALELLREMKENECRADTVTFNVILGGLCREERIEEALDMVENLPHEGVYLNKGSYRIVLNSLTKNLELKKAKEFLHLMLGRGFLPHYATSNELLVHLCKAGMVDDAAMALFNLVEMGFQPGPDSWGLLIDLICRDRKLLYVFELLDELVITNS